LLALDFPGIQISREYRSISTHVTTPFSIVCIFSDHPLPQHYSSQAPKIFSRILNFSEIDIYFQIGAINNSYQNIHDEPERCDKELAP
jgi:hypothetical protein